MKTYKYFSVIVILALLVVAMPVADVSGATINTGALNWSVQYLIDQSQTVLDKSQFSSPRDNRGLALSHDGQYLYAGYNSGSEVRKIDLTEADYTNATVARTTASRGKAIAVDDQERVYLAEGKSIKIYDADLSILLGTISGRESVEGVAVKREGGDLALYATDRTNKTLTRWILTESDSDITAATQAGLGGTGEILVAGAVNLRGVEVDPSGKIWMADLDGNRVFRVNSDGTGLVSVVVTSPIDIGFDDEQAFITQYTARTITILKQSDMTPVTTLTPPWVDLKLDPIGQGGGGALSGIAMGPGSFFYVANEAGQTADEKSTYGREDSQSGLIDSVFYTDTTHDDNDPILKAMVPNQPPVADPNGPYLGAVNTPIAFDGSGSSDPDGNPLTYAWTFGDGNTGTGVTPTHTYTATGIYDVCLTVNDGFVDSAEVCTYAVVYDPSGGFVTGGGWITSPEGAMSLPGPVAVWDQDFSTDASGWFGNGITVDSGVAELSSPGGQFSRFDGYRDVWPGTYTAEIDVYLDPSWPAEQGFDYSVAANGSDGNHQRDYIFHVGTVENYGTIVGKELLVAVDNNTYGGTNPFVLTTRPGGYYIVPTAGWYTLQHVFHDAGGYLAVDFNILDANGTVVWSDTTSDVSDTIPGEVGGNRYAWFVHIDVAVGIQVDNHQLILDEIPSSEGKATFGFVSKYKKGASVPEGNTQFQFQAGDLNFHSTSYEWLVVTGSNYAKFKGAGTINGQGDYKFQLWAGDNNPDTFRIKIWYEENGSEVVVYDNGPDQAIGGGSIVVHKAK